MVNAWSLLYDEINGTLDKEYPIMNQEYDSTHEVPHPENFNELDDSYPSVEQYHFPPTHTKPKPDLKGPYTKNIKKIKVWQTLKIMSLPPTRDIIQIRIQMCRHWILFIQ